MLSTKIDSTAFEDCSNDLLAMVIGDGVMILAITVVTIDEDRFFEVDTEAGFSRKWSGL